MPLLRGAIHDALITVRRAPAAFSDWRGVRALILDAFAYMDGRIDPPSSIARMTPQSMAQMAAAGGLLLAHLDDAALVGCAFIQALGDALYVTKLAVRPDMQRRGIGRALIDAARSEAQALGLAVLEVQVRIEMTENVAAFTRLGFTKVGDVVLPGRADIAAITMRTPA